MIHILFVVLWVILSAFQEPLYADNAYAEPNKFFHSNNPKKIIETINEFIGVPYRYGGDSNKGIDCSGLVKKVYQESLGITLPRTVKELKTIGIPIEEKDLILGDLVFFNTKGKRVSHVGIYIEDLKFVHASTHGGVKYSLLTEEYYKSRYVFARRVYPDS